jgi:hypothetical protein
MSQFIKITGAEAAAIGFFMCSVCEAVDALAAPLGDGSYAINAIHQGLVLLHKSVDLSENEVFAYDAIASLMPAETNV